MNNKIKRIIAHVIAGMLITSVVGSCFSFSVKSAQSTNFISYKYYEFDDNSKYEISTSSSNSSTSNTLGSLTITGDCRTIPDVNGFNAYEVSSGNVNVKYQVGTTYLTDNEFSWHVIKDKSNTVDGVKLGSDILMGTVIVQSSLTGDNWITDSVYNDVANRESGYDANIYVTKNLQQVNGCYYRIIVVYELEKRVEDTTIGFITNKNYDDKKCAEVYTFYLIDSEENQADATKPSDEPRMTLGTVINTGKDNGYSGNEPIDNDDPHYNWEIGSFFVNGYTRSTVDASDNSTVFIKTLGDRVTLWFNLEQDINALNNNSKIFICEDTNGYDRYFQTDEQNFKHGALIIRFTDHEGVRHVPVIYTDFLAACATTGANTKVELFEEGDYEVALDYEIKDERGINTYHNYRIFFTFKIRNGNCMAFPFDVTTRSELSDGAITANGFYLDMAKSRYLTIDVIRYSLKLVDGIYVQDARSNSPAKDGETYTQEGVYQFTVKNLYTNTEDTSKCIYVGTSPIYKALARGIYSLDEINAMLIAGGILEADGTITMPVLIEEPEPEVEPEADAEPDIELVQPETQEVIPERIVDTDPVTDQEEPPTVITDQDETEKKSHSGVIILVSILVLIAVFIVLKRKKDLGNSSESNQEAPEEKESDAKNNSQPVNNIAGEENVINSNDKPNETSSDGLSDEEPVDDKENQ